MQHFDLDLRPAMLGPLATREQAKLRQVYPAMEREAAMALPVEGTSQNEVGLAIFDVSLLECIVDFKELSKSCRSPIDLSL